MASEQSELDRTSSLIGRYLLTGWILSDEVCPNKGCNVPLLRSKDNSTWLCARCDNNDSKPRSTTELPYQAYESFAPPVESIGMEQETSEEVEERQLRRKQSQLAAQLIGERMLQGWTLLDEICPNETCYGASVDDRRWVPLIRSRYKKKYCVICQKYYMDESSSNSDDKADSAFLRVASMVNRDAKEIHRIDENDSESSFLKDSANATEVIKSSEVETRTIVTLKAKMEELREQLEHEHDIGNINELCQSIQSCVATLGTIEELIFKRHLAVGKP